MTNSSPTAEDILFPWMEHAIQPSQTMLWVSAVAPETFQGNPRFLEELLRRPLEAPDALGWRRASARFGACLLAHAIQQLNPDPPLLLSLLQTLDFFRHPDTLITRNIPRQLNSIVAKLAKDHFDPTPLWAQHLATLPSIFRQGINQIQKLFGIRQGTLISPKIYSFFTTEQDWWSVKYYPSENVVNIHPPFLFVPSLAKGLLLREAVRLVLPAGFHTAPDIQEFANQIVATLLNEPQRQLWTQIKWGGIRLASEQLNWIASIAPFVPQLLQQKRLPSLFHRLHALDQEVTDIPKGAFVLVVQQELADIKIPQTVANAQRKILVALAKNPRFSERQLVKETKLARSTIKRNLTRLENRFGLFFQGELNYRKVNLTPLLLRLNAPEPLDQSVELLQQLGQRLLMFPYCVRIQTPLTLTNPTLYAILILPEKTITGFWDYLQKWTQKTKTTAILRQITAFEWGWSFRYWNKFPLDDWSILARSTLRRKKSPDMVNIQLEYEGPPLKLRREALRVIVTLQNNMRLNQRQVAEKAQTSVTTASNYITQLTPTIIKPYLGLSNTPLQETMITDIQPQEQHFDKQLLSSLRLLPIYQIWHLSSLKSQLTSAEPALLLTAGFPKGGLVPFIKTLPLIAAHYGTTVSSPTIISSLLPQIHGIPHALFQTMEQEWTCPAALLEDLFHLNTN
ncbi:MAG: winged helix-turn-helix domain-containing protein [Candidatus Hodarchaeota archaeon]